MPYHFWYQIYIIAFDVDFKVLPWKRPKVFLSIQLVGYLDAKILNYRVIVIVADCLCLDILGHKKYALIVIQPIDYVKGFSNSLLPEFLSLRVGLLQLL